MVEGNVEEFIDGSFCEPMMTALLKKNNVEKADYVNAVEQQLKLLDIKFRKLKIVKKEIQSIRSLRTLMQRLQSIRERQM